MSRRDGIKHDNSTIDKYSDSIVETVNNLLSNYCLDLDNIMQEISEKVSCSQQNIPDTLLEKYILSLANILYYTGSAQEDIGIKEDICKAVRQEAYANVRSTLTGTVADRNTQAELLIQRETTVLSVYSRAYKKIKFKVDAGYEMLNSLKKIMNKRISELELSNSRYINRGEED